jgi:Fur family transcriptional regulator, ferric uptake regulator
MKSGSHAETETVRSPDVARLRSMLEAHMAKRGLRSTGQRRVIIDTFFESSEHLTLDQLLKRVKASDPRVGYATVYRTMKMLVEGGIVHEHKFGDGFTRFELADSEAHHDHLICVECGKIEEFEEPLIEELQARIATRHGFQVTDHKHEIYGVCASCQERAQPPRGRSMPRMAPS